MREEYIEDEMTAGEMPMCKIFSIFRYICVCGDAFEFNIIFLLTSAFIVTRHRLIYATALCVCAPAFVGTQNSMNLNLKFMVFDYIFRFATSFLLNFFCSQRNGE